MSQCNLGWVSPNIGSQPLHVDMYNTAGGDCVNNMFNRGINTQHVLKSKLQSVENITKFGNT